MKLTQKQITENDIILYVPDDTEIPEEVRKTLRHFTGIPCRQKGTNKQFTKYTLPAYLVKQWLRKYNNLLKP